MRSGEHRSHTHKAGKKFARHSTCIEDAKELVNLCERIAEVSKIVLGQIVSLRAKMVRRKVKLTREPAGWKAQVLGFTGKQVIHIYTSNPDKIAKGLEQFYVVEVQK